MKRILIATMLLAGCGPRITVEDKSTNSVPQRDSSSMVIKTVQNCQYVVYLGLGSGCAMVHAGNCNNPEHKIK